MVAANEEVSLSSHLSVSRDEVPRTPDQGDSDSGYQRPRSVVHRCPGCAAFDREAATGPNLLQGALVGNVRLRSGRLNHLHVRSGVSTWGSSTLAHLEGAHPALSVFYCFKRGDFPLELSDQNKPMEHEVDESADWQPAAANGHSLKGQQAAQLTREGSSFGDHSGRTPQVVDDVLGLAGRFHCEADHSANRLCLDGPFTLVEDVCCLAAHPKDDAREDPFAGQWCPHVRILPRLEV